MKPCRRNTSTLQRASEGRGFWSSLSFQKLFSQTGGWPPHSRFHMFFTLKKKSPFLDTVATPIFMLMLLMFPQHSSLQIGFRCHFPNTGSTAGFVSGRFWPKWNIFKMGESGPCSGSAFHIGCGLTSSTNVITAEEQGHAYLLWRAEKLVFPHVTMHVGPNKDSPPCLCRVSGGKWHHCCENVCLEFWRVASAVC